MVDFMLTVMPTYGMSYSLLPSKVLDKVDKLQRDFLWTLDDQEKHKLHYFNWNLATNLKLASKLDIRNLQMQNLALLGKKAWELAQGQVICAKFFKVVYFSASRLYSRDSYTSGFAYFQRSPTDQTSYKVSHSLGYW